MSRPHDIRMYDLPQNQQLTLLNVFAHENHKQIKGINEQLHVQRTHVEICSELN